LALVCTEGEPAEDDAIAVEKADLEAAEDVEAQPEEEPEVPPAPEYVPPEVILPLPIPTQETKETSKKG
jgi:hypothetical protein